MFLVVVDREGLLWQLPISKPLGSQRDYGGQMSDADRPERETDGPEGSAPLRVLYLSSGIPHEIDGASTVLFYHYVKHVLLAGHAVMQVLAPRRRWVHRRGH